MKVDTFTGSLGGNQNLDLALAELLLGIQSRARLIARAGLHAAVDAAHAESPGFQSVQEIVQRVLELGEEEQALILMIEETLFLKQVLELREFRLGAGSFNRLGLGS